MRMPQIFLKITSFTLKYLIKEHKQLDHLIKEHLGILTRKHKQTYKKVLDKQTCWHFDLKFFTYLPYEKQRTLEKST